MQKKLASEIIRQSLLRSQLNNSDMYEWQDLISYLNNSYQALYGQMHTKGDMYHVRDYILEGSPEWAELPEDFFQLAGVYYMGPNGIQVPLLRSPNIGSADDGYRLENNKIIFTNINFTGPLTVKYVPRPQTITFPFTPTNLGSIKPDSASYLEADDYVITRTGNSLNIKFIQDESESNIEINNLIDFCYSNRQLWVLTGPGPNFNITRYTPDGITNLGNHNIGIQTGNMIYNTGAGVGYRRDSDVYVIDINGITQLFQNTKTVWQYAGGILREHYDDSIIWTDPFGGDNDYTDIFVREGREITSIIVADPFIYVNYDDRLIQAFNIFEPFEFNTFLKQGKLSYGQVFAVDTNDTTGRGVLYWDDRLNRLYRCSFVPDTEMNFPNNIYFSYLETIIAADLKINQGGDTTNLQIVADQYWNQLQLMLSQDTYKAQRINNVRGTLGARRN